MGLFQHNSKPHTAEEYRKSAQAHLNAAKTMFLTFLKTGVIMVTGITVIIVLTLSWFVSNSQVGGSSVNISATGQNSFVLATKGMKEQGAYDSEFFLSGDLTTETIGGTEYFIASANSSFRVSSDKNLNNYLVNADLRPGNRGYFELYVIRNNSNINTFTLNPVMVAYQDDKTPVAQDQSEQMVLEAAEYLKGHFLLFSSMDDKGMYSGYIDCYKPVVITIEDDDTIKMSQEGKIVNWGSRVENGDKAVYCFPVYWVWPDQFGNFIYTGNAYNKNLFVEKGDDSSDYNLLLNLMKSDNEYKRFFAVEQKPSESIDEIVNGSDFQVATKYYDLYSEWYNLADERIGEYIRYIELGFEINNDAMESGGI